MKLTKLGNDKNVNSVDGRDEVDDKDEIANNKIGDNKVGYKRKIAYTRFGLMLPQGCLA